MAAAFTFSATCRINTRLLQDEEQSGEGHRPRRHPQGDGGLKVVGKVVGPAKTVLTAKEAQHKKSTRYEQFRTTRGVNSAVECHPHTVEVTGPNPVRPTKNEQYRRRFGGHAPAAVSASALAPPLISPLGSSRAAWRNFASSTTFASPAFCSLPLTVE